MHGALKFSAVVTRKTRINSMRNAVIMPLHSEEELVIATDNHGSIGEKAQDAIHISNEAVGYAACRVAMMELLAVKGKPLTIVMQNFTGDAAWEDYKSGVQQVLAELQMDSIAIVIKEIEKIATETSPLTRSTVGYIKALPGGVNVIPSAVEFSVDIRDTDQEN